MRQFFDPDRVVRHPELSLAGGAIRGWDRRNAYYFQLIQCLAEHFDFDIETPFEELPEDDVRDSCCFMAAARRNHPVRVPDRVRGCDRAAPPAPSRASSRTWSAATARPSPGMVREELAKYLSVQPCPGMRRARA